MRNTVKSRRISMRTRTRIRVRQKLAPRFIVIFGAFGAGLLIVLATIFNLAGINHSKADPIDIRQVEDQVFINDMSIPALVINSQKKAGVNTIFIQRNKKLPIAPIQKHE